MAYLYSTANVMIAGSYTIIILVIFSDHDIITEMMRSVFLIMTVTTIAMYCNLTFTFIVNYLEVRNGVLFHVRTLLLHFITVRSRTFDFCKLDK